jgi:hypothetical protein
MYSQNGVSGSVSGIQVIGGQFVPILEPNPSSYSGLTVGENIYGPNGNGGGGTDFDSCYFQGAEITPAPVGSAGWWVITAGGTYNAPDRILTSYAWASYYAGEIISNDSPQGCATWVDQDLFIEDCGNPAENWQYSPPGTTAGNAVWSYGEGELVVETWRDNGAGDVVKGP